MRGAGRAVEAGMLIRIKIGRWTTLKKEVKEVKAEGVDWKRGFG